MPESIVEAFCIYYLSSRLRPRVIRCLSRDISDCFAPTSRYCRECTGSVIRWQGKSCRKWALTNPYFFVRKMVIAQNLCVQFTPDHFSDHLWVKTYPGMYSLWPLHCFRESWKGAKIFPWPRKSRDCHEISIFLESCQGVSRKLPNFLGSGLEHSQVCANDL